MTISDLFNVTVTTSVADVDKINRRFYGRFSFPWPPQQFPVYPPGIAQSLLNQDIGHWSHDRITGKPAIWVAGCGTNQALFTALKFPDATVLGTDISTSSIDQCSRIAEQIGVKNLTLEVRSLNEVEYVEAFDYIINTGVIHHNADPAGTLKNISRALKKNGVLELMVYNYYHRLMTTACQRAVRMFYDSGSCIDIELELRIVRQLMSDLPAETLMGEFLKSHSDHPEVQVADSLLQPVEYSYTVESLDRMAGDCNLQLLTYCMNQFDVAGGSPTWNMHFSTPELAERYAALPDLQRWQISNLLKFNGSPMLWFYLQRKDADEKRQTEKEMCHRFLGTRFKRNSFPVQNFEMNSLGDYVLNEHPLLQPSLNALNDPGLRKIVTVVNPNYTMKDIFDRLAIQPTFDNVNKARIKLTTPAFPYLIAVSS